MADLHRLFSMVNPLIEQCERYRSVVPAGKAPPLLGQDNAVEMFELRKEINQNMEALITYLLSAHPNKMDTTTFVDWYSENYKTFGAKHINTETLIHLADAYIPVFVIGVLIQRHQVPFDSGRSAAFNQFVSDYRSVIMAR